MGTSHPQILPGYCVSYKHTTLISSQVPYTSNCHLPSRRGRGQKKSQGKRQVSVSALGLLWREPLEGMPSAGPGSSETLHGSSTNPSRRKEHVSTLRLSMSQTYLVPGLPSGSQPCLPTPRFMHTPWPASNQVTGTGPGYWPA